MGLSNNSVHLRGAKPSEYRYMRIDTHCSIGRYGDRRFTTDELSTYLDQTGFDLAFVANLDAASRPAGAPDLDEVDANEACLAACRRDERLRPLYWVRPGRRDSNVYAMAGALATEDFAGAIFSPARNEFAADAVMLDPYLQMLSRLGVPAVFCTNREDRSSSARMYTVARRHPRVAIVLSGIASDVHFRDAMEIAQRARERNDARIYLNASHAGTEEIVRLVKTVSADRILFASDWPHTRSDRALRAGQIAEELQVLLPPETCKRILSGNALHLFRCKTAERIGA